MITGAEIYKDVAVYSLIFFPQTSFFFWHVATVPATDYSFFIFLFFFLLVLLFTLLSYYTFISGGGVCVPFPEYPLFY